MHSLGYDSELAFVLATTTGNRSLICATIKTAVQKGVATESSAISPEWRQHLVSIQIQQKKKSMSRLCAQADQPSRQINYRNAQMTNIFEGVQWALKRTPDHGRKRCDIKETCQQEGAWLMMVGQAVRYLDLKNPVPLKVVNLVSGYQLCSAYEEKVKTLAGCLERTCSEWVECKY